MGAAAFLMAEYMGVPYATVALKAILPAVLYFAGIYIAVHLEAQKLGLKGIPKEELPKMSQLLPKMSQLLPKIYLLLPLVVLVSTNTRSMQFSATVAIFICIFVGLFNKDDRITIPKIIDALEAGGKGTITVAVACAMAGIVAGCITSTGLAASLNGFLYKKINPLFRILLAAGGLGMMYPGTVSDLIGAVVVAIIVMQKVSAKKQAAMA